MLSRLPAGALKNVGAFTGARSTAFSSGLRLPPVRESYILRNRGTNVTYQQRVRFASTSSASSSTFEVRVINDHRIDVSSGKFFSGSLSSTLAQR